jgi:hypothetical protein
VIVCISCREREQFKMKHQVPWMRNLKIRKKETLALRKWDTYSWFGVGNKLWVLDQIAKKVMFHIFSCSCTSMTWKTMPGKFATLSAHKIEKGNYCKRYDMIIFLFN